MAQQGPTNNTWLKAKAAAEYSNTSTKTIYAAVKTGQLKAARIGSGRNFVTSKGWVDEWLTALSS